jgi:hypothetical protein
MALLVCVSLLQTPVPIIHCHAGIESETTLGAHLTRHHQGDASSSAACHWHFILPCELGHHDEGEASDHLSPRDVAVESDFNSPSASIMLAVADLITVNDLLTATATPTTQPSRASGCRIDRTAGDLRPAVRACALLCVLRC